MAAGKAEGKAEAKREALLAVLAARGIEVPDELREKVLGCGELDQLDTWFHRSLTATNVQDVLSE